MHKIFIKSNAAKFAALFMSFVLIITLAPSWTLSVNATETNPPASEQEELADVTDDAEDEDVDDDSEGDDEDDEEEADDDDDADDDSDDDDDADDDSNDDDDADDDSDDADDEEESDEAEEADGGEQGEEEPLEIPQINNIQNMVLMSAPAMLAAAADPGEGEGDGLEEGEVDEQKIAFAIDGWEDMSFTFRFACNGTGYLPLYSYDGKEWFDPMENEDWYAPIPPENGYIELIQNPVSLSSPSVVTMIFSGDIPLWIIPAL